MLDAANLFGANRIPLRVPAQNLDTHFKSNQRLNGPVVQLARNTRPFFGPYSRTYAAQQIDAVDGRGKLEQERLKETEALLSICVHIGRTRLLSSGPGANAT